MPALLRTAVVSARMVRLTPHRRARGQSGDRKLVAARWVPTSEDEHAVSMLTLGPCQASIQAQCLSQKDTTMCLRSKCLWDSPAITVLLYMPGAMHGQI